MSNLANFDISKLFQVPVRRASSPGGWERLIDLDESSTITTIVISDEFNLISIFWILNFKYQIRKSNLGKAINIEYGKIDFENDIIETVTSTRL